MNREWLIRRFSDDTRPSVTPGPSRSRGHIRGDHDLDTEADPPAPPLTPAAVLVPLVQRPEGPTVLLTRRTEHLANHGGQISFPGGHQEPGDETPEDAALRETEEEIGLDRGHLEIIGRLDTYITRTGFRVTPVVALVEPPFDLIADAYEVDEVFEVPLAFFLDPANHQRHSRFYKGRDRQFYAMPYGDYYIWGATAAMLVNLYEFLTRP